MNTEVTNNDSERPESILRFIWSVWTSLSFWKLILLVFVPLLAGGYLFESDPGLALIVTWLLAFEAGGRAEEIEI